MNRRQAKINEFQVWIEQQPERYQIGSSYFKQALNELDSALSFAFLAAATDPDGEED